MHTIQDEPTGWHNLPQCPIVRLLCDLKAPSTWPFLCDPVRGSATPEHSLDALETICDCEDLIPQGTHLTVPRPCGKHQIVLHAFSGRRRPGDLQYYMEHLYDRIAAGVYLIVVSLDIVIDPIWGDVVQEDKQNFWYFHAQQGAVAAFLCGPPCETWSRARFAQLPTAGKRGPRPVRSTSSPWGLYHP